MCRRAVARAGAGSANRTRNADVYSAVRRNRRWRKWRNEPRHQDATAPAVGGTGLRKQGDFEQFVERAFEAVPAHLRDVMSNVQIVIEDEPPPDENLLGLYEGVPLTGRDRGYVLVPPDKITIYRGPLERHFGTDPLQLEAEVRRVVFHEIAHHFGISDERLIEIDRY